MDKVVTNQAERNSELAPHDSEAEAGVLGCILTGNGEAEAMLERLHLEDFYDLRHQEAWRGLQCLKADGRALNEVEFYQWAKDKNRIEDCGGFDYVQSLPDKTPTRSHAAGVISPLGAV